MDQTLRKLTLVGPVAIESAMIDCLDRLKPDLPGYTIISGEGRGLEADLPSPAERVRGAMRVITVLIILQEMQITPVLEAIREACPRPNIAFWVEPILDFGRLK